MFRKRWSAQRIRKIMRWPRCRGLGHASPSRTMHERDADDIAQVLRRWAAHVIGDGDASTPVDGRRLCILVENLTGRKPTALQPSQNLSLVKAAFETMEESGLPAAALTCSPEEVANGDEGAVATLLWELAQVFFISPQFPGADGQWKGAMMAWCQSACAPRGVSVTDFHRSWQNGLALLSLLDASLNDPSVINMATIKQSSGNAAANVPLALSIAQKSFSVPMVLEAEDLLAPSIDERAVFVYLSLMHSSIRAKRSSGGIPAPAAAAASSAAAGHDEVEASSVAKQALLRAMAGRPQGRTPANVTSAEIMRVTALVEELREPINNVAEVLQRGPDMGDAEAKATFRQLTERMRRLVEILPDTLECTQEAQSLEESIQAELRKVRARAEFEEAYIARLVERQRQCRAMSQVLQENTSEQMELLRAPLLELLRIVDSKEKHLKSEIIEVERDKISILQHSQTVAESDLERMRTAEAKAEAILKTKIPSVTWLETGHSVEDLLVGCEAGRIEGKSDFPEAFADFNCTLDLRLEHNVARACDHALSATEFEERKVIQSSELLNGFPDVNKHLSSPAALMVGSNAKDAMVIGASRQSVQSIVGAQQQQQQQGGGKGDDAAKRATWSMTVDGDWVRIDDAEGRGGVGASGVRNDEIEKVLAYARRLPPKEADEYLSQDFVRSILNSSEAGKGNRQSDRILQAALHESLAAGRAPPMGGLSGDYSAAAGNLAAQIASHEAVVEAGIVDGTSVLAIGGWDGTNNLHSLERLGNAAGAPWGLVGSLSSSRRGLAAALCAGKVYVIGGWDGTAYLSTVEVYDVVKGTWTTAKSMPKPRCFAAAVSLGGKVYVAGGYYGSYNLETVEVYDPDTDEWSALPSMSCARRGLALATLGSSIYAIGGWDGKHNLSTVEVLSLQGGHGDAWQPAQPLSAPRCSASATSLAGKIYVCGGWDGTDFLSSVEVLDPSTGLGWLPSARMLTARSYGSLVAVAGKLVALGGWDGVSARRLDSVEEFNPAKGSWEPRKPMTSPRYGLAAVTV